MNSLKALFLLPLLAWTLPAGAALDPLTNVLELALADVRVPAHEADTLTVRPCNACEETQVRVSGDTLYRVGGFDAAPVSLTELQGAVRRAADKDALLIYVEYDVATGRVTQYIVQGTDGPGYADSETE